MSTQPTIIQIVDRIDPTIAAKINGIATAARTAATDVNSLQAALNGISGSSGLTGLTAQLSKINPVSAGVASNTLNLAKALGTIGQPSTTAAKGVTALGAALATTPQLFTPANAAILTLSQGLGKIPVPATSAWQKITQLAGGSSTLTGRLALLAGRVVGMEAGLGRLGGAFAGVGTAAAGAGPFLIGALAVGAVLGAIVLYEKFRDEAQKLLETQAALANQMNAVNDRILEQKEQLVGLTSGPLAKYAQELKDLPLKNISIDFSKIKDDLEQQHSWWAIVVSDAERFFAIDTQLTQFSGKTFPQQSTAVEGIRDIKTFLDQQEALRASGKSTQQVLKSDLDSLTSDAKKAADSQTFNKKVALEQEMVAIRAKIAEQQKAQDDANALGETRTASIAAVNISDLRKAYDLELINYQEYLGKKAVLTADAAKAAVAEQLKQFTQEMDRFKASVPGGVTTAQEELALRQQQLAGAKRPTAIPGLDSLAALNGAEGGNVQKLTTDINKLTEEINKQGFQVDNLVKRYQDAVLKTGAYSDALKVEAEYDKLVADVQAKRIPITDALAKRLHDVAEQGVEDAKINRELVSIYNEFQGPVERYATTLKATTELLKQNAITAQQAEVANARAARAMQDAIDPLNEYKIGLQHETDLLKQYGEQLNVATEVDRVRQELQRQGYDLDQKSIDTLSKFLTLLDQQRSVQAEETRLWEENAGAKQKIYEQQLALNKAYFDGVINLAQWKAGALDAALATNTLNNEISGGTLKTNILQLYGNLIQQLKGAHPVIGALQTDFGNFFATLKKGFAESIAHVLVFGGSIKTALLDVARNAVAQLISSLIELGIEILIVTALQKAFGLSLPKKDDGPQKQLEQMAIAVASIAIITATQLAAINALMGPAWALAEAISLASFGANAAAATAGIASVVAAGTAARSAGRFAGGGLVLGKGTGTSDDILAHLSNGEFVVNARATARNRDLLEAINRNDTSYTGNLVVPSGRAALSMKVNVTHDGSTGIHVEQIDESTVRIIARQEARGAVQEHGPRAIAADLYNPNSETSKAVARNIDAKRKR